MTQDLIHSMLSREHGNPQDGGTEASALVGTEEQIEMAKTSFLQTLHILIEHTEILLNNKTPLGEAGEKVKQAIAALGRTIGGRQKPDIARIENIREGQQQRVGKNQVLNSDISALRQLERTLQEEVRALMEIDAGERKGDSAAIERAWHKLAEAMQQENSLVRQVVIDDSRIRAFLRVHSTAKGRQ